MYYNHKNKLIISKSFKTASSSLHFLLKRNHNSNDSVIVNDHFTIMEIREKYGLKRNEVIGIVGIRNPWDYVVSAYFWAKKNRECPKEFTFDDFILKETKFNWKKQHRWWNPSEIDDVLVFEDLKKEIQFFNKKFNIEYTFNERFINSNSSV